MDCSPELVPNSARDYSVYVLDPLESGYGTNMLINGSSASTSQSPLARGVAMGLGLMSWALSDPDCKITVNGTIMDVPSRGEMLEVVFALREVRQNCVH